MTYESKHAAELAELMSALCDEYISDAQVARLEEMILVDEQARRFYLDYIDLHGTLHWDTAVSDEDDRVAEPVGEFAQSRSEGTDAAATTRRRRGVAASFAACVVVVIAIAALNAPEQQPEDTQPAVVEAGSAGEAQPPTAENRSALPRHDLKLPGRSPNGTESSSLITDDSGNPRRDQESTRPDPSRPDPLDQRHGPAIVAFVNGELRSGWRDAGVEPSKRASDAEWIRRVYLDVVGHIPPAEDVDAFLQDEDPEKRTRLVDELLDHEHYARNWSTVWGNLLIGRSDKKDVDRNSLRRYLRDAFENNRPWNELVTELISAQGAAHENGAANYLLAHLNNQAVPATAITAKLFLCTQIQCTQCHDHPFHTWQHNTFWELNAFFKDTRKERRVGREMHLVSGPTSGPTFFEKRNGVMVVAYPQFEGNKIDPEIPVDRREALARMLAAGPQPQIADAMVNRMWAHFFGQAFTREVDDMGPHSSVSHPDVLDRLSREFVRSGFDMKQLVRWICSTDAYQRSSRFGESNTEDDPQSGSIDRAFSRVYTKPMTIEQVYDSLLVASGGDLRGDVAGREHWMQQFIEQRDNEENGETTTFDGGVTQALTLMNGPFVAQLLETDRPGSLSDVIRSSDSDADKIRRLCLATLSRYPSAGEVRAVQRHLRDSTARRPANKPRALAMAEGLQDVFWAYLNSNEFLLVH